MIVIVRTVCRQHMVVVMLFAIAMQDFVRVIARMLVRVRMNVLMRVPVRVRVGMNEIAMPVHMLVRVRVRVAVRMLVRMRVRPVMGMAVFGIGHRRISVNHRRAGEHARGHGHGHGGEPAPGAAFHRQAA